MQYKMYRLYLIMNLYTHAVGKVYVYIDKYAHVAVVTTIGFLVILTLYWHP